MSTTLDANTTIGELASALPAAPRVFERLKLDYCCGGARPLAAACLDAGLDVETVLHELTTAAQDTAPVDFRFTSLTELIEHIVARHHVFTRDEMARLTALAAKVCAAHGERHPEVLQVGALFEHLCADLEPHMLKEERVLFPYITGMERAVRAAATPVRAPFVTVDNPVRMMRYEHDAAGALLRELRGVTNDYEVPADACLSYRTLYRALADFEQELHQHIHLENNLLFPRALELENELFAR